MPLTLAKETIQMDWKEQTGKQSSQILLEGDMIVPDSKPDLQKILWCEGKVKLTEQRMSDERISFSGELAVFVLYTARNGERPVYAMKTTLPIEDFIHMDGLQKDMEVHLTAELEHLDCQIINDRKLGIKAVIGIQAQAEQQRHAEILSGAQGEGIECLTGTLRMETDAATLKDRFTVKEEMILPAGQPEFGEILRETVNLTEQDIRPMEGKVMLRGNLKVCLLYTDPQGTLDSFTEKIPFSGYLEGEGIDAKTAMDGSLRIEEAKLTPTPDEDGEVRQLAADITIGAMLQGKSMEEKEILLDAYAPNGEVQLTRETISYPMTAASGKNQFVLKERIALESGELPMLRTEDAWGEVRLSEARTKEDAVEADGVLTAAVLYYSAEDAEPICLLERGIPFTQVMELKGVSEGDEAQVDLRLEDMDFQILSEREGELRANLTMEAHVLRNGTAETVTDVIWQEETGEQPPMAGAVIYMVQPGDSLWTVAKRYHTTIDDILAVNDIEDPDLIYPGQKLLIIKMMG